MIFRGDNMLFFFDNEPFIAVIGDIRDSRNLESRKNTQERLKNILNEINERYSDDITSKFLITIGDEFQGLLSHGKNLINMIQEIKIKLYPVEIRFGVGIGKITTEINTEMALGADGPGYYNARRAINLLKENEKKNKKVVADIYIEDENDKQVVLINTIFELMKVIEQNWTERQRDIIWDMMQYKDTQKNVAVRNGITQASVNKMLLKGNYYVYDKAIKSTSELLGEIKV